jgi:thioredoxin reductase (NADPH)
VCDGFFYRGQEVAIVGAGDTACEEASYLANLCSKVYMIVRRDEMRASKIMQERVIKNPKIEILYNALTEEVLGNFAVEGVRVKNAVTGELRDIPVSGFFVAIGHEPNSKIFLDYLNHDEQGYLITTAGTSKTNVDGVFACGDVQDHVYRQAVTAAGTGCMAALDAERYLVDKELH